MSKAVGSRARILVNRSLKSPALDHVMGVWFGALALTALFVGLSPAPEAVAAVNRATPRIHTGITPAERHCMVQTAIGEATPGHKAEVIAIMRGMLARRASGRWGSTICSVVKAKAQYSVWNDRAMPKKPKKPSKLYKRYSKWADLAVMAGPSRFKFYWHGKAMRKLYKKPRPYWAKACVETARIGGATMCRMGRNNS